MKTHNYRNKKKQVRFSVQGVFLIVCFLVLIALTQTVSATPPSNVVVSYSLETQELQVTITHQVSNPTTHYIYKVEIEKNGVLYNTSLYTSQPDPSSFTYTYHVNATTGDTIAVTATCIQGQSKTAEYTIATNNGGSKKSTPGFEGIIVLGAVFISLYLLRRK